MSTTVLSLPDWDRSCFELEGVSWDEYLALARVLDRHHIRTTYLDGRLELVSPLPEHEMDKEWLGLIVRHVAVALGGPVLGMEGRKRINLRVDPPPDLAIEVEVTRVAELAMATPAQLEVPEVWRYNGRRLRIGHLQADGIYADRNRSLAFPRLKPAHVQQWMQRGNDIDDTEWSSNSLPGFRMTSRPAPGGKGGASWTTITAWPNGHPSQGCSRRTDWSAVSVFSRKPSPTSTSPSKTFGVPTNHDCELELAGAVRPARLAGGTAHRTACPGGLES